MNELPEGWAWKKLGEVCDRISEKHQPSRESVFYVGLEHIEKDTGRILSRAENIEATAIKSLFQTGDILYGKLRPYLNKVAVADKGGVCSTDILVLRPKKLIVSGHFLHLLMLSHEFVNVMSANTSGVNLPRVPTNFVMDYAIPLPPLPVQHAIVTKIEEIFSELDHGVEQLKTAREQLKVYRQAVLKWAFEGRLTNEGVKDGELPEGWKWVKSGEVINTINNGYTPTKEFLSEGSGEIPFIKVYNLNFDGTLNFKKNPTYIPTAVHQKDLKRSICYPGDVLINIVGPPLGKISVVTDQYPEWNINQAIVLFRPNEKVTSKFIAYFMQNSVTINWLENTSKATAGQWNVKVSTCREIPMPLVPLPEQHRIVSEIERRLSVCDKLEETIAGSLKAAEVLRAGVLKRAFEGRLVGE